MFLIWRAEKFQRQPWFQGGGGGFLIRPHDCEKDRKLAIEKVREYFRTKGMEDKILEFDVSSATVELAAEALGCEGARIAKSLSFKLDDSPIIVVAAGDAKVDNQKYKARFGAKAKMLTPDEVLEGIGHAVGGVCPFAVNDGVKVYMDVSLKRFTTVYPACGSSNSAIELTPDSLYELGNAVAWVDVCKAWQSEA